MSTQSVQRRDLLRLAALGLSGLALGSRDALAAAPVLEGPLQLADGWRDFSPTTHAERTAIPTACWQCVTRDAMVGYVEGGRVVKLEGHPDLPRTNGKLCAKGLAGVNQVYSPDRLLYPMVRTGPRGGGQWKRISWDAALGLIVDGGEIAGRTVTGLKALIAAGEPERFMFHYGRLKASASKIVKTFFCGAMGTKTIGNHTSICEAAKWTAQELTWGSHYDNWDLDHAKFVLNFGSNVLEAHTNHIPMSQRLSGAMARGVKLVTFDVRLSNTAAKSTEWQPVKPGTDLAVVLAMCHVLLKHDVVDHDFIATYTNVTVKELRAHCASYTPEWASEISGVPAEAIARIALEYGRTRPSVCLSYRGAVTHYNGVQTERAIMMLEAIAGNIDIPGGRCRATGAKWKYTFKAASAKRKLKILDGIDNYAWPTHHVSHQVFDAIRAGDHGRPAIYMFAFYNPVYANGDCQANIDALKDETLLPFTVAADVALSEGSELADLVLPDATYLERWEYEDMVSANNIPEFYIRQPLIQPLGEARSFTDVVCDIAKRVGRPLPFNSAEEFVRNACENTPGVREAGGFEYMKKRGVWVDPKAKPRYRQHEAEVDVTGCELDAATGVYWNKHEGDTDFASLSSKHAAKQYVAQRCGDGTARRAFPPDSHMWKTGFFEIRSGKLASKGFDAIPAWMPIPEHAALKPGELILTTYKVAQQVHSRTQNCKWLSEIYHDNPAWINSVTAAGLGIADGDAINVRSSVGAIVTRARVTEAIVPGVIGISHHCGHWAYGEYASGKESVGHVHEADCKHRWWNEHGVHPNWLLPNKGDPISGTLRFNDTVVTVSKA